MANIKPAEFRTGHTSNEEIKKRKDTENKLKGNKKISAQPPVDLSDNGKRIYKEIIKLLPKGFLSSADTYTVRIVAESLDCMKISSSVIHKKGLFTDDGKENEASKAYERYSKIYDKFSAKIGLSPKDRAAIASIIVADRENKDDELLKVLRGDDD
jgi:P27 family predicted phage terminase small subunit